MAERERRKRRPDGQRRKRASSIIQIEDAQKRRKEKRAELVKAEKLQRRREKTLEKKNRPKMTRGKKLAVCGVMAVAVLLFAFSGYRIINLNLDKAVYEQTYEEKLAEKARLEKELNAVDDLEYIEQQARSRFHMLRSGEVIYVFPEAQPAEVQ